MPIDRNELKNRQWPTPPFPIGKEIAGRKPDSGSDGSYDNDWTRFEIKQGVQFKALPHPADYCQSCYVHQGSLRLVSLPIPPGECGINSLARDKGGKIYGLTNGEKSHLFCYDAETQKDQARDLGTFEETAQKGTLVVGADGLLYMAGNLPSGEGCIYSHDPADEAAGVAKVCCPVQGEGIAAIVSDENRPRIYGLSNKSGTFFLLDTEKGTVEIKGTVDDDGVFSETLVITPDGDVFGGCRWSQLFKYDAKEDRLAGLDINAPIIQGREMYNRLESLVYDKNTDSIFGGTSADGILFRYYPGRDKMVSLGKPFNQPHIRCLTIGHDNAVYGIAGRQCCHLFKYDAGEGDLRDLGMVHVRSPRFWHCYECDAAVTGKNGEIYLGQNERISYLHIYTQD
ncbi:MAG: hypothetical protein K8S55_08270 [Phycisphaerae bacterium]|nr:hypothetical protein [Phycisphaerae bacterium]